MAITVRLDTTVRGPARTGAATGPSGALFRVVSGSFSLSDTYPSGGESLDLRPYVRDLKLVLIEPKGGYSFMYDRTTRSVRCFVPCAPHTHTENLAATYTQNATTASSAATVASELAAGASYAVSDIAFVAIGF